MAKVSKAQVGKCVGAGCGKPARFEKKAARAAMKAVRSPRMKDGGSLKPVPEEKKKSLGKLPTAVRNKMGFQKAGGKTKAKAKGGAKVMKGGGKCKYGC